jgi:hypothetical protein
MSSHSDRDSSEESTGPGGYVIDLRQLCDDHLCHAYEKIRTTSMKEETVVAKLSDYPLEVALNSIKHFNKIKRGDLTPKQQAALQVLDSWNADNSGHNIADTGSDEVQRAVPGLITALSDLFFFPPLDCSKIEFKFQKITQPGDILLGDHHHAEDYDRGVRFSRIRIHPDDWSVVKRVRDHKTALSGTLFHECIHAFLTGACCTGHNSKGQCLRDGKPLWESGSEHSAEFIFLAAAMEIALDKLCDMGTDLAVFGSFLREYQETGLELSSKEWTKFFELFSWTGVSFLVSKLTMDQFYKLSEFLIREGHEAVTMAWGVEYVQEFERPKLKLQAAVAAFTAAKKAEGRTETGEPLS